MFSSSDSEEDDLRPVGEKRVCHHEAPTMAPLPVHLTWKGVQIFFPKVVLTRELKERADEALAKKIAKSKEPPSDEDNTRPRCPSMSSSVTTSTTTTINSSTSSKQNGSVECEVCGIKVNNAYSLTRHSVIHLEYEEAERQKRFGPCKCGATFSKNSYVTRHMKECKVVRAEKASTTTPTMATTEPVPDPEPNNSDGMIRIKIEESIDIEDHYVHPAEFEPPPRTEEESEKTATTSTTTLITETKTEPSPLEESQKEQVPSSSSYSCDICKDDRTFANRQSYISHVLYHRRLERMGKQLGPLKNKWEKSPLSKSNTIPEQDSYTCEICKDGRTFVERQAYISHVTYHQRLQKMGREPGPLKKRPEKIRTPFEITVPEQDSYNCECCNREFTSRTNFIDHLRYHEKVKRVEGQDRKILTKEERAQLAKSMSAAVTAATVSRRKLKCDICDDGRTFKTRLLYQSHMAYHARKKKEGKDGPCKPRGSHSHEARRRKDVPWGLSSYTCTCCLEPRTFTERNSYIIHINYRKKQIESGVIPGRRRRKRTAIAQIPISSIYRCKHCPPSLNKTFTDRQKYICHLNYHRFKQKSSETTMNSGLLHQGNNNAGTSGAGGQRSVQDPSLMQSPVEKFACTQCCEDKVFTSRESFQRHLAEHRAMKKKEYQCSVCEKAFTNMWSLKSHAKTHVGEKKWVCGDCGKRYLTQFLLQEHQQQDCKKIHCKYSCHCGDKFHTIDELEQHVIDEHPAPATLSKIFKCYVCNEQFLQALELDKHVQERHPVDYQEFMRHIAEKEAAANAALSFDEEPEPIYPEVIMECGEDNPQSPQTFEEHSPGPLEDNNSPSHQEDSTTEDSNLVIEGGGGWNFIPGLAGDDVEEDNSDESDDEEVDEQVFLLEPEDVEVPGADLTSQNFVPEPKNYSSPRKTTPVPRRESIEFDKEWTPDSNSTKTPQGPSKQRRTYKNEGQFQCGYCDKTSHRLAYIKTHFSVHQGLPFKFINLKDKILDPPQPKQRPGPKPKPVPTANVTPQQPFKRRNYETLLKNLQTKRQQEPPVAATPPVPIIATVSPQVQSQPGPPPVATIAGRRSSNPPSSARPGPQCSCIFEDTALGYHKRCTGETCDCYSRHKGCGELCNCKGGCGNPFFRQVQKRTDTEELPASSMTQPGQTGTWASSGGQNNVDSSNYTGQDVINTIIESAFKNSNSTSALPATQAITQQQQWTVDNGTRFSTNNSTLFVQGQVPYVTTQIPYVTNQYVTNQVPYVTNQVIVNLQPNQLVASSVNNSTTVPSLIPINAGTTNMVYSTMNSNSPTTQFENVRLGLQQPFNNAGLASGGTLNRNQTNTQATVVSKSNLNQPPQQYHQGPQIFRCFCNQDYNTLGSFLLHQWNHKNEHLFLCPICKKSFTTVHRLILHAKSSHSDVEEMTLTCCSACDAVSKDARDHSTHFRAQHSDLICEVCNKCCTSKGELTTHRQVHGHCSICGLTFFNQTALRHHLAQNHKNYSSSSSSSSSFSSTLSNPSSSSSSDNHSSRILTGSISSRGDNGQEVVTLVDLADSDQEERPPSPEVPVIVSVSGTLQNTAEFLNHSQLKY